MQNRLTPRARHSEPHLQLTPTFNVKRSSLHFSSYVPLVSGDSKLGFLPKLKVLQEIITIENDKVRLYRENLLFSRFLRRFNRLTIVETYEEYEDESDVLSRERADTLNRSSIPAKLPEFARLSSVQKTPSGTTERPPLWSKLTLKWREHILKPFLLRVQRERLRIAVYELEQSNLDSERMKTNAIFALNHLHVLLQAVKSDVATQEALNLELRQRVIRYKTRLGEEKFNDPRMTIPGEMVIGRINKRIHSRISLIGRLRVNSARTELRIRGVIVRIRDVNALRERVGEVDVCLARERKTDYAETDDKLERQVLAAKVTYCTTVQNLHAAKETLNKQEAETIEFDKKRESFNNLLRSTNIEYDSIEQECATLEAENEFLRKRMADIETMPTISNYVHVIHQGKELQHEIDIWTKRVNIAETLLSQLKQQSKAPSFLPPLQPVGAHRH